MSQFQTQSIFSSIVQNLEWLKSFLQQQHNRSSKAALGIGNCFSDAYISFCLVTSTTTACYVACYRSFESLNHKGFEGLLIPQVNWDNMERHIKVMMQPGTWATHVQVLTAATYSQLPLYNVASLTFVQLFVGDLLTQKFNPFKTLPTKWCTLVKKFLRLRNYSFLFMKYLS